MLLRRASPRTLLLSIALQVLSLFLPQFAGGASAGYASSAGDDGFRCAQHECGCTPERCRDACCCFPDERGGTGEREHGDARRISLVDALNCGGGSGRVVSSLGQVPPTISPRSTRWVHRAMLAIEVDRTEPRARAGFTPSPPSPPPRASTRAI